MIAKIGLVLAYSGAMFNMLVVNSIKYPENIPHVFSTPEVWLYPEIERAWNLLTEQEVPYEEERELLQQSGETD